MRAESIRDRAFIMALGAWTTFGHSNEPSAAFATRIAEIGVRHGLSAAAKAISDDCAANGLQMSPARVLKGLAHDLQRVRRRLEQIDAVDELTPADLRAIPPGVVTF